VDGEGYGLGEVGRGGYGGVMKGMRSNGRVGEEYNYAMGSMERR
jgi:hypothetical protein